MKLWKSKGIQQTAITDNKIRNSLQKILLTDEKIQIRKNYIMPCLQQMEKKKIILAVALHELSLEEAITETKQKIQHLFHGDTKINKQR